MTRYEHATVHLNGVHLYGYHGMSEEERQVGNHFCIHVGMDIAVPPTGFITDSLDLSVNYAEAYEVVKDEFCISSMTLEHLATRIIEALLRRFTIVEKVEINIEKMRPPFPSDCQSASVRICAYRDTYCP